MGATRWLVVVAVAAMVAAVAAVASAGAVILAPRPAGGSVVSTIAAASTQSQTVTVEGQGTATAVPDQARITVGVGATRGSVRDAVNAAGSELGQLIGVLRGQGVADADIHTTQIGVQQVTNGCCPAQITGYLAYTDVTVLIHHLANVQGVIAAATEALGNDTRLQGVSLSIGDPSAAVKTARVAAMKDAADRAKQWADAAGLHLGKILGVSEMVNQGAPGCTGGCGGGGGIPVQGGESSVAVTVTVAYEMS